jgi:hypothetical protein
VAFRSWIPSLSALAFATSLLCSRAHAQSASEIAAAKQWFTEGVAFEEKGQFKEALERFQRARGVKATPQILFHVGLCEAKTGALVEGLVDLERAVELAKSEGNTQVVSAAESEIASLRPRVPKVELVLQGSERPSKMSLDDKPLAESTFDAALPVNPGDHVLKATFATGEATRRFSIKEGEQSRIELGPPAAGEKPPPPPPVGQRSQPPVDEPKPPQKDEPAGGNVLPWVLIGGGVVATAGGFFLWKLRGDQVDKLDAICPARDSCPSSRASEVDDLEGKGKLYTTLGIGSWVLGGAALATGAILLVGSKPSEKALTVSPAIGPNTAGALFGARF